MLNEQVESVMAIAFELARIREEHGAQSGMYLSEVRALRAEAERLAAQAAPTDNELGKRTTSAATARSHEIPNGSESANQVNPADQRGAPEPVANGGDARGASGGCARPTACTHPACQCVAQSAPFKREDLTLAAVNCEHQIDADCVRLWRDETKEGTALSQLVDRVAAVVAQSAQPALRIAPDETVKDAEVIRLIEESGALLAAYEPRVWLVNLKDVRALLAEAGRLAAQAAPTEPKPVSLTDVLQAAAPAEIADALAPVVQAVQTEVRFKYESMKPIDGYDAIYAEYATTFGRYPDDFMSKVVRQTKEDLFMWWGAHREKIRAGLVLLATTQAVRMLTRDELNDVALSEQVGWGPGEYVEAIQRKFCEVNKLRIPADGVIGGV